MDDKQIVEIRLPNGEVVERELSKDEIGFWVSLGMYLAHGFHAISTIHAAQQMDDFGTIDVDPEEEQAIN